jgi:hypothetical protein
VISVVEVLNGEPVAQAQALIHPGDVDIAWEGETVVPPLYAGLPLPNGKSAVRLLAVPHIAGSEGEVASDSLVYSWKENGLAIGTAGYGVSSIEVAPPLFGQSFTISVHAETPDGTGAGDGEVTIQPQNPLVGIYENAPLLGILFNANIRGTVPFPTDEVSFRAYPFFVSNPESLATSWTLDGQPFSVDPAKPLDTTFRKVGSGSGSHSVTFSFKNDGNFLEHAASSFTLSF